MVDRIKEYQKSVLDKLPEGVGPADKKFVDTSPTGIPITQAQKIIQGNQPYATDAPLAPFQELGNILLPGQPFGKENRWLMNAEQKKIQEARQLESQAYVKRKDDVRDKLAIIFDMAQKRIEETDDVDKQQEYKTMAFKAKNDIMRQAGFSDDDFLPVGPETYSLYDEAGLFTNTPNPYPVQEAMMYMGAGTYGSIKGFNNPNFGLVKKFMKGAGKGFVKGKGGWLGRVANAVIYGAMGVGAADFGYEVALDTMNRAGKAKGYMKADPETRLGLVDSVLAQMPEALTFGPEGINRPDLKTRLSNAMDAMIFDASISAAFFGVRPAYMMVKKFGGALGGFKTKPPASGVFKGEDELSRQMFKDLGSPTPEMILAAEKALQKFDPVTSTFTGKRPGAFIPFGKTTIPVTEKIQMNIPLIGGMFTRLMKGKAFNWLGPSSNRSEKIFPELETIAGTTLPRFSVAGRPYVGTYINAFQRVPAYGGPIKAGIQVAGEAQKIRFMEMLGRFAPYVHAGEMGIDYLKLSSKSAKGFRNQAIKYDKELLNAAKSSGAIVGDDALVAAAKDILFRYGKMTGDMKKAYSPFAQWLRQNILKKSPKDVWAAGTTLLNPGRRSIGEMYQLKRQMDNAYMNWSKSAEVGTVSDDISKIYKAFEADIGTLGNTPFKHITSLWKEYENFLSNGMLLWGTDIGRAMKNVKRYGFNVVVGKDPVRASQSMWNVLAKSHAADDASGAFITENIHALRNIVGDKAYYSGLGHYLTNVFKKSISTVEGIQYINPDILSKSLGIGRSGSNIQKLFKEALPGPVVTEFKIWNPNRGRFENWYDDLWGKIPASDLGRAKALNTQLPKYADFENLATVLDRVFKYGMPAQSTFLARATVLQGPQGALKSGSPLGAMAGAYASHAAGGVPLAMAGFFGLRYLGKVLTNPIRVRNWTNAMDDTLPIVLRVRNLERLIQAMPDEYEEWTATLKDMETSSRTQNMMNQNKDQVKSMVEKAKGAIPGVLQGVGQAGEKVPQWIKGTGAVGDYMGWNPKPDQTYADEAPDEAYSSGSELGSSITGSNVMNPGAAASLYTGDTDAALANQYGGMNQGGMVMNPVMNNQGKFVDPQKGINDNPFVQNANNKGIMGVL